MNELERIVKLEKEKQIKSKEDLEREKPKEKEVHEQKLADSISELNKSTVESNQKKRRTQGPMTSQVYDKQMKYDDQDLIDCVFEKNVNKSEIQKQKSAYGY